MSTFEAAIPVILKHEGGWVSDPQDPGGETNFGISTLIVNREAISNAELGLPEGRQPGWMKSMKVDAAKKIYQKLFWDRYDYGRLGDQAVATKIFDVGVNCGPSRAHAMAQRAATACGHAAADDGIFGPKSVVSINACNPQLWLLAMRQQQETYYRTLVARKPQLKVFLRTWLRRAAWIG